MKMYEAPTVVELGNFHEETGVGLGDQSEGGPIAFRDRPA